MPVITAQDVIDKYRQYAGREPTAAEIQQHVGQTVGDIDAAARSFFGVQSPSGGGGFESPFDFGALFEGFGPTDEELALIREQVAALRQQREMLSNQLRMADVFGRFQTEQAGYQWITAPEDFAARQQLGQELGLDTIDLPKGFKERQKLGEKLGIPGIEVPKDKAARQTLAQQLGIKPNQLPKAGQMVYQLPEKVYDLPEAGQLVQIKPGELGTMKANLERELTEHSLKALRGELPVSPTLERSFQKRDQMVDESIRRQLGPGGETSSAGIEAKGAERQFQTEALEAARRGELSMSQQLGLGQAASRLSDTGSVAGTQAPYFGVTSGYGQLAGGFGNAAATSIGARTAGYGAAAALGNILLGQQDLGLRSRALDLQRIMALRNFDFQDRQLGVQNDAIQAQRDAAMWNAIASGAGLVVGSFLS